MTFDWSISRILRSDWLLPVREVGVALGRCVAGVADEEVCPSPEDGAAAGVVRHREQALADVELTHVGTWRRVSLTVR